MGFHYLPQEYLRGFEDPECPGTIWMYDKRLHRFAHASIKSVAQEVGYYTEKVERQLSELIEGPAHGVLKKLRQGNPIDSKERMWLAMYIATMLMRVPRRRRKAFEMLPSVSEQVIKKATATIKQWVRISAAEPALKAKRLSELERVSKKFRSQAPHEVINKNRAPWPYKEVLDLIVNMTWRIASSENAGFFLTSDNPVFYVDSAGLGNPESEITFPLASNLVLFGNWKGGLRETIFIKAKKAHVKEANRRIASSAERFVFYRAREAWVAQLAEKQNAQLNRIKW